MVGIIIDDIDFDITVGFEIAILEYLLRGCMKQTIHVNHEIVDVDVDLIFDGGVDAVDFIGKAVPKEFEEVEDSHCCSVS